MSRQSSQSLRASSRVDKQYSTMVVESLALLNLDLANHLSSLAMLRRPRRPRTRPACSLAHMRGSGRLNIDFSHRIVSADLMKWQVNDNFNEHQRLNCQCSRRSWTLSFALPFMLYMSPQKMLSSSGCGCPQHPHVQ